MSLFPFAVSATLGVAFSLVNILADSLSVNGPRGDLVIALCSLVELPSRVFEGRVHDVLRCTLSGNRNVEDKEGEKYIFVH